MSHDHGNHSHSHEHSHEHSHSHSDPHAHSHSHGHEVAPRSHASHVDPHAEDPHALSHGGHEAVDDDDMNVSKSERYELQDLFRKEAPENQHFLKVVGLVVLVVLLALALAYPLLFRLHT